MRFEEPEKDVLVPIAVGVLLALALKYVPGWLSRALA